MGLSPISEIEGIIWHLKVMVKLHIREYHTVLAIVDKGLYYSRLIFFLKRK
jgi:hypothetical protein